MTTVGLQKANVSEFLKSCTFYDLSDIFDFQNLRLLICAVRECSKGLILDLKSGLTLQRKELVQKNDSFTN